MYNTWTGAQQGAASDIFEQPAAGPAERTHASRDRVQGGRHCYGPAGVVSSSGHPRARPRGESAPASPGRGAACGFSALPSAGQTQAAPPAGKAAKAPGLATCAAAQDDGDGGPVRHRLGLREGVLASLGLPELVK